MIGDPRMNKFINITLQLKDENIIFDTENVVEEKKFKNRLSLFYHAKLETNPQYCPACGCVKEDHNIVKNGTKKSRITLTKVSGLPAYLVLRKQRYYCKECTCYFTAKSDIVGENCFISKRVKRMVMDLATKSLTLKHISNTCSISDHTVQRVIDGIGGDLKANSFDPLPEHIAFDEFKSVKNTEGNMSFVFIDNRSSQIVDILSDRRKNHLRNYFLAYPLKTRQRVKTVTMDMYTPYMEVVQALFPNAKIIIDRFHLVQALNRELNKLRVAVMNEFRNPDHRLYNKYKNYWRLFLTPRENLDTWHYQPFKLFDWLTNTGGIVEYLLDKNQMLKASYNLVHTLREALQENDYEVFLTQISQSKLVKLPNGLRRVLRTFTKLQRFIGNTFKYKHLTNGRIEGLNNKIKVLKRIAYGYRNFQNFRTRILLTNKLYLNERSVTPAA